MFYFSEEHIDQDINGKKGEHEPHRRSESGNRKRKCKIHLGKAGLHPAQSKGYRPKRGDPDGHLGEKIFPKGVVGLFVTIFIGIFVFGPEGFDGQVVHSDHFTVIGTEKSMVVPISPAVGHLADHDADQTDQRGTEIITQNGDVRYTVKGDQKSVDGVV